MCVSVCVLVIMVSAADVKAVRGFVPGVDISAIEAALQRKLGLGLGLGFKRKKRKGKKRK